MEPCNNCEKELFEKIESIHRETIAKKNQERETTRKIDELKAHVCLSHMRISIMVAITVGLTFAIVNAVVRFLLYLF